MRLRAESLTSHSQARLCQGNRVKKFVTKA
jgi:hypothetical protein